MERVINNIWKDTYVIFLTQTKLDWTVMLWEDEGLPSSFLVLLWDSISVGEENKTFIKQDVKTAPSRYILKTVRLTTIRDRPKRTIPINNRFELLLQVVSDS